MKTSQPLLQEISNTEIITLTQQVKETLATGYNYNKQFSSADLWNIQRQRKAIRTRRVFGV